MLDDETCYGGGVHGGLVVRYSTKVLVVVGVGAERFGSIFVKIKSNHNLQFGFFHLKSNH